MSKHEQEEKSEKDEKDLNKHEEKSVEEKWQRDRLGAVVWALILIWAGFVLLASNVPATGKLPPGSHCAAELGHSARNRSATVSMVSMMRGTSGTPFSA